MIDIKDKFKCSGCSACVQKCPKHCISLVEDNEGFLYPKVDANSCIQCGACDRVCPFQQKVTVVDPKKVIAAYNKNEQIRQESSSGGIFSLLAEKTIKEGGVVFGARFDEQWQVVLDYTEAIEGIAAFRGSKYVQASVNNTFQQCETFLKLGRLVLFSGTPCQIAGLKKYLGREYSNLLTLDVVCHGVPSPMIWRRYLSELVHNRFPNDPSTDLHTIKSISFRDKSIGWKDFRFVLRFDESFVSKSNEPSIIEESHNENLFMRAFLSDLILRPSCFKCPFRGINHRQADISIADFWGIQKNMPEMDDNKGTSLVFINTDVGWQRMVFDIVSSNVPNIIDIIKHNGGLVHSIPENNRKAHFFQTYKDNNLQFSLIIHLLPEVSYQDAILPPFTRAIAVLKRKIKKLIH